MHVADVDGVRITGPALRRRPDQLQRAADGRPPGATASHAANPTSVQDVFFRIGGAIAGKATDRLVVNNNDTMIDDIWAWRGDHGSRLGWTVEHRRRPA